MVFAVLADLNVDNPPLGVSVLLLSNFFLRFILVGVIVKIHISGLNLLNI